jgi:hypothetical protein
MKVEVRRGGGGRRGAQMEGAEGWVQRPGLGRRSVLGRKVQGPWWEGAVAAWTLVVGEFVPKAYQARVWGS